MTREVIKCGDEVKPRPPRGGSAKTAHRALSRHAATLRRATLRRAASVARTRGSIGVGLIRGGVRHSTALQHLGVHARHVRSVVLRQLRLCVRVLVSACARTRACLCAYVRACVCCCSCVGAVTSGCVCVCAWTGGVMPMSSAMCGHGSPKLVLVIESSK